MVTTTDGGERTDGGTGVHPRTLLFFRHAKSNWDAEYGDDDQRRPLSARGRKAAKTMGRFLANARQLPDAAVTSPAVRAQNTLELAMRAGGWSCPVLVQGSLYGEMADLLREVRRAPTAVRTLLLVGHQPACSDAIRFLSGAQICLPTAAVLRVNLQIPRWEEVDAGTGWIEWLITPRLLGHH